MDNKLLSEVMRTKEKVIAISLHQPERRGFKGYVISFDGVFVEFQSEGGGRIDLLPISAFSFRRVEKEEGR